MKWLSSKPCHFVKKYVSRIKLLHANAQYVCNMCMYEKCGRALRGVDYTKYALSTIILLEAVFRKWLSSKHCHFVKNIVLDSKFFMNVSNKSVICTCMQNIEAIQ